MAVASLKIDATLGEGEGLAVDLQGRAVFVCRSGGQLFAVDNRCTHAGSRLDGGRLKDGVVTCPLHGAKFDLASGQCVFKRLNYAPLQTYAVHEADGQIHLAARAPAGTVEHPS